MVGFLSIDASTGILVGSMETFEGGETLLSVGISMLVAGQKSLGTIMAVKFQYLGEPQDRGNYSIS